MFVKDCYRSGSLTAATKRAKIAHMTVVKRPCSASADELATACLQRVGSTEREQFLPGAGPRQAIGRLAGQILSGGSGSESTWQLLQTRVQELKHDSRKDKQSLASGLRAWHAFATMVLEYHAEDSIPPRCSLHVLMYLALFRNAGTASNYLGCLLWACKYCLDWYDHEVRMTIQGLKNHQAQQQDQLVNHPLLLDECLMSRLAALCKEIPGFAVAGELFVLSWAFLGRVQSEGVPLEAGTEELRHLPGHRHSAVVIVPGTGSLLVRPCTCTLPGGPLMCALPQLLRRWRSRSRRLWRRSIFL